MKFKADEISSIIKERIENFDLNLEIEETGKIISVADGVAKVYGLKNIMAGEMVEFENGEKGMALNLEESSVGIVILGKGVDLREGSSVKRLKKLLKVPVGEALVSRVVNALGEPIDAKGPIDANEFRFVEEKAKGIMARKSVHEPLITGIKAIDALVPIGRGQRELIIGDRQTGKTTVAIEYAVNALKVKNIVVCGHSNCGGCNALYAEEKELESAPNFKKWLSILDSIKKSVLLFAKEDLAMRSWLTEKLNLLNSLQNLLTYPGIKEALEEGKMQIHAWYYIIETGEIYECDIKTQNFSLIQNRREQ